MARPSTSPPQAPTDCSTRAPISTPAFGATAVTTPARVNSASPPSSTGRRPNRSDSGPYSNCPIANPIRYSVMVSWIVAADTCNPAAVAGSAGMIMCIPSVPLAVTMASSRKGARWSRRSSG